MAPRQVRSPYEASQYRLGQRQKAEHEKQANRETSGSRSFDDAVTARTSPDANPAPTELSRSLTALTDAGAILRVPAGGTASLEVSGLQDWHYDDAMFGIAMHGANMALPLTLTRNEPGPDNKAAALTLSPTPPVFMGTVIYRYEKTKAFRSDASSNDKLLLEVEDETIEESMPLPAGKATIQVQETYIGGSVSKVSLLQGLSHDATPQITAILPNTGDGLRISRDDDRSLHQVPRKLVPGDSAETADLADYLNEKVAAGEDRAAFLISSRTDCVLKLDLQITRRRKATGQMGDEASETLTLTPWKPESISPKLPAGDDVTVTLTASPDADGPALTGLREQAMRAACQGVELPRRVSLLQPFTLPGGDGAARRFAGVWLCLSGPPASTETLQIDIKTFAPETQTVGDTLASAKAEISARQMDLEEIGAGLFAQWAAFDAPLEIDVPDLENDLALILSDATGPIPLLECSLTLPQLQPALSRNMGRSDRWVQRRFGHSTKALMFELGETSDAVPATLQVESGAFRQTITITPDADEVTVTLPGQGQIALSANRHLVLDKLHLFSTTTPETLG